MSASFFKVYPIKSVLVGMDLTEMDNSVVKYADMVSSLFPVEDIYFVHVEKDLSFPEDIPQEIKEQLASVDEGIKLEMKKSIDAHFSTESNVNIHIECKEGNPTDKILRFSKIKNIDLIILGKKIQLDGDGVISNEVARSAPCHLLFVPETSESPKIKKIMVTTDFSEHSKLALDYVLTMNNIQDKKVFCSNVYQVPKGYSKVGKSYDEFADIMLQNAEKDFKNFTSKYDRAFVCEFVLDKNNKPVVAMMDVAQTHKPDLIVMGSKGRTNLSTVFLGSTAEKLSSYGAAFPILIIKNKGENMGVFEALLNL